MGWDRDRVQRAGWNPWSALSHLPDVEVQHHDLGDGIDGVMVPYPGRPVILLDRGLTQAERNAVLAHELVHLERDWPCAASWVEEERVWDEVARRLVPLDQLRLWVVARERAEVAVEAWDVAEEWHVPEAVAGRALRLLWEQLRPT